MKLFKITGVIWLVLCLAGAIAFTRHLGSIVMDPLDGLWTDSHPAGFWILQFFAEAFLLAGVVAGLGLMLRRRWGAMWMWGTSAVLLLYSLVFLFISRYVEFHIGWFVESLVGIALAAYSLFVVWKFKPDEIRKKARIEEVP